MSRRTHQKEESERILIKATWEPYTNNEVVQPYKLDGRPDRYGGRESSRCIQTWFLSLIAMSNYVAKLRFQRRGFS